MTLIFTFTTGRICLHTWKRARHIPISQGAAGRLMVHSSKLARARAARLAFRLSCSTPVAQSYGFARQSGPKMRSGYSALVRSEQTPHVLDIFQGG